MPHEKNHDTAVGEDAAFSVTAAIRDRLLPYLHEDMTVLDLACGSGELARALAETVKYWEAADASEEAVARARSMGGPENLRYTLCRPQSLPYEHETFDAVLICCALQSLTRPERILREARRVLKSNGLLFAPVVVWGGEEAPSFFQRMLDRDRCAVLHRWTASTYTAFLESSGFHPEEIVLLPGEKAPVCYVRASKK